MKELLETMAVVISLGVSFLALNKAGAVRKEQEFNDYFGNSLNDSLAKADSLVEQINLVSMAATPEGMKKAAQELLLGYNEYISSLDLICTKIDTHYKTELKSSADEFVDLCMGALASMKGNDGELSSESIKTTLKVALSKLDEIRATKATLIKKFDKKKFNGAVKS